MKSNIVFGLILVFGGGLSACAKGSKGKDTTAASATSGTKVLASNIVFHTDGASLTDSGVDPNLKVDASNVVFAVTDQAAISATNVQDALVQTNLDPAKLLLSAGWARKQMIKGTDGGKINFAGDGSYSMPGGFGLTGAGAAGTYQVIEGVLILKYENTGTTTADIGTGKTIAEAGTAPLEADCAAKGLVYNKATGGCDAAKLALADANTIYVTKFYSILKVSSDKMTLLDLKGSEIEVWSKQ